MDCDKCDYVLLVVVMIIKLSPVPLLVSIPSIRVLGPGAEDIIIESRLFGGTPLEALGWDRL